LLSITVRNVNHALPVALLHLKERGAPISPRGAPTLEYPTPVCTTYLNPTERVLFDTDRDANPFFHLMEALWILAGRKDVEWIGKFNAGLSRYSDNGWDYHAAYGDRLRNHFGFDQLVQVVNLLKKDPDTRRAVAQIWSANDDLNADTLDVPCNDLLFFKIRDGELNLTVANRSNDVIWGAYGANVVQFSIIQEYVAAWVGVEVGVYRQVSDSFHVYTDNPQWDKLSKKGMNVLDAYSDGVARSALDFGMKSDQYRTIRPQPLVEDINRFNVELKRFTDTLYPENFEYNEPFFRDTAVPMVIAWKAHKQSGNGYRMSEEIASDDWRISCENWMGRRETLND
jgi:hypothetical protein